MHPQPEVEAFLQEYVRVGDFEIAAETAEIEFDTAVDLLRIPGVQARLRQIFAERGKLTLEDRAVIVGKLDALCEWVEDKNAVAAARILAIQARVLRDLLHPGREATQFKPGPRKTVLTPGKQKAEAESAALDSEGESGSMVDGQNSPQPLGTAHETGS